MTPLDRARAESGAVGWLGLAATPTFAIMALLSGVLGPGSTAICSAAPWSVGGMIPMYLLMSAFHASPWLKLMADWRGGVRQS